MTWTSERTSVNQKVQIGAESTSALGTSVAASKLLECFTWTMTINGDVVYYTPTGHKYASTQEENTEWTDASIAGNLDYNGMIYPLASICGSVSPVTHGSSAVAKDWIFAPPTTGSIVPQTYTLQMGDSVRAHQTAYNLFTALGYTITRKATSVTGSLLGQPITDGITPTGSPTAVAVAPVAGKHVNVYLDSTSAALGTTQLTRPFGTTFAWGNVYGPVWPLNRANIGWSAHVDLLPTCTIKLKVAADAAGMALLSYLQVGSTQYLRVNAQGLVIDNLQTVALGGPSSGTFTLTYKGQTTSGIAYTALASAVQTALTGLTTVGVGNATVTGSAGGPYSVAFAGTLAQDTTAMTGSGAGLTGGAFLITQAQSYNTINHDMAVKVGKPSTFADESGVFAIEWELTIIEDPTWGHSHLWTVTNLLTAL